MNKSLRIACDGEAASGKSTGAKLVSKKYKLFLINSGLLYRYASKIIIKHKPKKIAPFLKKKFKNISYNKLKNNRENKLNRKWGERWDSNPRHQAPQACALTN